MRICFMGTPDFAVPSLRALVEQGYHVVGVFTQPDRPKGRGGKVQKSPVKIYAESQGIPVFQPQKIRLESQLLRELEPDFCVTAAFGQILSEEVLSIPRATINVHASLLPQHRGAAPVQWAILNGDAMTGVTTMLTDKGIDTGDMLLKRECPITEEDTADSLLQKLSVLGAELLIQTLRSWDSIQPIRQEEQSASYDPMPKNEMGEIHFDRGAEYISRQVRAFKSYLRCDGDVLYKIAKVRVLDKDSSNAPGMVLCAEPKKGIVIATSTKDLEILRIQAPGKKEMDVQAYLLGNRVAAKQDYKQAFR